MAPDSTFPQYSPDTLPAWLQKWIITPSGGATLAHVRREGSDSVEHIVASTGFNGKRIYAALKLLGDAGFLATKYAGKKREYHFII